MGESVWLLESRNAEERHETPWTAIAAYMIERSAEIERSRRAGSQQNPFIVFRVREVPAFN